VVLRDDLPPELLKKNPDVAEFFHYPGIGVLKLFPSCGAAFKNIWVGICCLLWEIATVCRLRLQRFDASMYLLAGGITPGEALITLLCGAKIRIGPHVESKSGYTSRCYTRFITWDNRRHAVENCLDNLRLIGFSSFDTSLRLVLDENDKRLARTFLIAHGVIETDIVVGIHPGGANERKPYWPADRFAAVAAHVTRDYGYRVVVFFGPGETHYLDAFRGTSIIPAVGLGFGVVCGIIAVCRLFISSDTGLGHSAAALQVPTLTIFGNGNRRKHHHWGNKCFEIDKLPPTHMTDATTAYSAGEAGRQAILSVTVEEVVSLAGNALREPARRAV
jgi:ADP-heptose:LPS heptosyltransferase